MDELHLPFPLRRSGWWRAYVRLRRTLDSDASAAQVARAWARLSRALVGAGAASVAAAVAEALDRLSPHGARLTGTGACVFAAFDTRVAAEAAARGLPARWRTFIVQGLQH